MRVIILQLTGGYSSHDRVLGVYTGPQRCRDAADAWCNERGWRLTHWRDNASGTSAGIAHDEDGNMHQFWGQSQTIDTPAI